MAGFYWTHKSRVADQLWATAGRGVASPFTQKEVRSKIGLVLAAFDLGEDVRCEIRANGMIHSSDTGETHPPQVELGLSSWN
jgi:hypothetical protein